MDLKYIENDNIVLITTNDALNKESIMALIRETITFAEHHSCFRILFDHRECQVDAEKTEIFDITKNLENYGITFEHKAAVVFNVDGAKYRFADTVIEYLSGGVVHFFDDYGLARKWILESKL